MLYEVFEAGRSDESIRNDLDLKYTMSSFVFTMTVFFNMISVSGSSYVQFMGLDEQTFITHTIQQLIATIKS